MRTLTPATLIALVASCAARPTPVTRQEAVAETAARPTRLGDRVEVVRRIPHDTGAFTQGLTFYQGRLYESTGLNGRSSVRVLDATTGAVLQRREVDEEHFAEGLTVFGRKVFQLTYVTERCFVYDVDTLAPVTEHRYEGEGWGLTHDGRSLILSDGSDTLRVIDPDTFAVQRRVRVTDHGAPVDQLNELEMVEGELFANVWHSDHIARIDPATGAVRGYLELPFSRASLHLDEPEAVLNGIAYEPSTGRLLVTGKLWPYIFEIRLRGPG